MSIILPKGEDIIDMNLGDPGPIGDLSQFRA